MKITQVFPLVGIFAAQTCWAVYAPIPEQEQGKQFSLRATAGISHDSNIFGAASNAISSTVYSFAPELILNSSLTDQTFFSSSYKLTIDHFSDRPGDKTLESHDLMVRLAHAFTAQTNIDVSDSYTISKNPESLLAGVPINTDQSLTRNQADGRFVTTLGQKTSGTIKARTVLYRFDNANLANSLDRSETLFGVELGHAILPETKLVGEFRHQTINYSNSGGNKDKQSNFLIGGVDYTVARKLTATGRVGYEWRQRDGERSSDAPYVELSAKYDYAEKSYITTGYIYTLEETSDVANFNDTQVNRFFVNVQHSLSALIVASGSFNFEPSTLQGRRGVANADETTTRFGAALSYLINKNWTASATFDHDKVSSDLASRGQKRDRYGLTAAFTF
ncbi:MAG: outer membrane beta-barrel protein [Cephaloticoccus sp.]|nr:outer membrane beta-barrel protein [Cephaloticoccus sp.]MCF7761933.1 outer membrane beta-barrel protein [Cephaloticoccus sp.]